MSFYTSLTGLNAATAQLSVTSNNIANVGTTGFKRSRADFGDIFATSPLQKASSVIGQGVALKAVTQEFSQGNVQFSANSLDVAITGDGFFPLKSADGLQDIYTRNGTFVLNDSFAVVNSAGQALMAATVDSSGKADLENLRKLYIPRATTGEAAETTEVELGLNLPADSKAISKAFDPNDPTSYNLTTAVTVFDSGGNSYLATVYYVKTQVASPEDPSNKWQTHVYIGNNKLGEYLIQATDPKGERQFVNKYGEIRSESQIPPQDIARGVSKLFNLDDLKNPQQSVPATAVGATLRTALVNEWKNGISGASALEKIAAADRAAGLKFGLKIDGSTTQEIDLYEAMLDPAVRDTPFTGVEMARAMTNVINKKFGDERYFDFSAQAITDSTTGDVTAGLFKVAVGVAGSSDAVVQTDFITVAIDPPARGVAKVTVSEALAAIETSVNAELTKLQADAAALPAGDAKTALLARIDRLQRLEVDYDYVNRSFSFKAGEGEKVFVRSATEAANELFGLTANAREVDLETGLYGADMPPNGSPILDPDEQRYGIKVSFDDTNNRFTIASGSSGDTSSVEISGGTALAKEIFGFPAGDETPIVVDTSRSPLRGIVSEPAVITGSPIGLNVSGKFGVDDTNNKFVITADNVTGLIEMPIKGEYTIDSFRTELERRINSLQDSQGRTVSGVKVGVERNALGQSYLTFTTGTTGDDSFLKISSASVWGLSGDVSARGTTSRWLNPPQATSTDGRALYVDREGLETVSSAGFDPDEALNLWSPIFLDKGELTFDTAGNLLSPKVAIRFKPETIGDTGATLQFSINYDGSTQYSTPFSVLAQGQNGRPEGELIGLDIADDGLVSANYSNGTQKNLAKIVLANFTAPTGLRQVGEASYLATSQSGTVMLGEAGTAGFGTIRAGARERANVDLTQELIELIVSQRNFQANAKAIETNNTLTQAIINIRS
jgi:flagellar hook-basal body protein